MQQSIFFLHLTTYQFLQCKIDKYLNTSKESIYFTIMFLFSCFSVKTFSVKRISPIFTYDTPKYRKDIFTYSDQDGHFT